MYEVDYDLTIHISGTVWQDDHPSSVDDLLDTIFPDGWEGEILGVKGDMVITSDDDDEEENE